MANVQKISQESKITSTPCPSQRNEDGDSSPGMSSIGINSVATMKINRSQKEKWDSIEILSDAGENRKEELMEENSIVEGKLLNT